MRMIIQIILCTDNAIGHITIKTSDWIALLDTWSSQIPSFQIYHFVVYMRSIKVNIKFPVTNRTSISYFKVNTSIAYMSGIDIRTAWKSNRSSYRLVEQQIFSILNIKVHNHIKRISKHGKIQTYILFFSTFPFQICIDSIGKCISGNNLFIEYRVLLWKIYRCTIRINTQHITNLAPTQAELQFIQPVKSIHKFLFSYTPCCRYRWKDTIFILYQTWRTVTA